MSPMKLAPQIKGRQLIRYAWQRNCSGSAAYGGPRQETLARAYQTSAKSASLDSLYRPGIALLKC